MPKRFIHTRSLFKRCRTRSGAQTSATPLPLVVENTHVGSVSALPVILLFYKPKMKPNFTASQTSTITQNGKPKTKQAKYRRRGTEENASRCTGIKRRPFMYLWAEVTQNRSKGSTDGFPPVIQNSSWSWVAGSLMTSLNSSEEDVSGLFGGWEGCSFRPFVLSVGFVGFFAAVCVDAVLLHLCAMIWGKVFPYCRYLIFTFLVPI